MSDNAFEKYRPAAKDSAFAKYGMGRTLSEDEKMAAIAATFLDQAGFGAGEVPLAWLMSKLPGRGTYADEMMLARGLQRRFSQQSPGAHAAVRGAAFLNPVGAQATALKAADYGGRLAYGAWLGANAAPDFLEGPSLEGHQRK